MKHRLLEFFFPQFCCGCERRIGHNGLCPECTGKAHPLSSSICPICGVSYSGGGPEHPCSACLRDRPCFDRARACTVYGDNPEHPSPIAVALHHYKYGRDVTLAPALGDFLAARSPIEVDHDAVVPVPLHVDRLRWRGFNQALLLARPLARHARAALAPLALERSRPTTPQVGLGESERRRNVRGAFRVRPGLAARGRSFLLVDDVMTTGATLNECARVLRQAGAVRVDALVLARVLPA